MATGKTGLEYFPLNVDFFEDDKITLIESEFGSKGALIAVKLLCKIYRESYYYKWGDDECLLFARKVGADIVPGLVSEVVQALVKRSFFDKGVFDSYQVLTSNGIQKRYLEAIHRRKNVNIIREFLLCDASIYHNVNIISHNVNIMSENANILKQSKVEESKVKESRGNARASPVEKYGNPVLYHVHELRKILEDDENWIIVSAKNLGAEISNVKSAIELYVTHLESKGEERKTLKDAKFHFNSWYRLKFQNGKITQRINSRSEPQKSGGFGKL
jgi:hypothetical protein